MYAGTHIVAGATAAAMVYRGCELLPTKVVPPLSVVQAASFFAGVATHFFLDAFPHSEYAGFDIFHIPLFLILIPEMILVCTSIHFWGCAGGPAIRNGIIALGAFGGAVPDMAWMACSWFDRFMGASHSFSRLVYSVHGYWHATESLQMLYSVPMQIFILLNCVVLLNRTRSRYLTEPV